MFGFDEIIPPLHTLPPKDRQALASLIEARNTYRLAQLRLDTLKVQLLRSTDPAEQQRLTEEIDLLAHVTLAPARTEHSHILVPLLKSAVDIEELKELAPMLVLNLLQTVNLPLLMEAFGLDADNVKDVSAMLKQFLK